MTKITRALLLSGALAGPAAAAPLQGTSTQDFGNRLMHASNASVGSQFLSFPLPMSHVLKGRWQLGVDGGYSSVDAGVLKQKGPLFSFGGTYALADHWGLYAMAFSNQLSMSGGGSGVLVTPFVSNIPLDIPNHADFSSVRGDIRQLGFGAAGVWDPLVSGEDSHSLPLYIGLLMNNVSLMGAKVDYVLTSGASAGSAGVLDYTADYTFVMPMMGVQYARNVGKDWRLVPSVFFAKSLEEKPQKGRITRTSGGAAFDLSGTSGAAGFGEANFNVFVFAVGTTVIYRPWGLGANLGATAFRALVGKSMYDGVEKVVQFDLSWRFGNYVR